MNLLAPRPIRVGDDLAGFCSGNDVLDAWLKNRALRNEGLASRTYVACDVTNRIAGYYTLAVGSVLRDLAPGSVRRNMPDPVPVMVLARLAVGLAWQGNGIGRALIRDANSRTLRAAEVAGIRAILAHAIDSKAADFYRHCGFIESPANGLVLLFPLHAL